MLYGSLLHVAPYIAQLRKTSGLREMVGFHPLLIYFIFYVDSQVSLYFMGVFHSLIDKLFNLSDDPVIHRLR